MRYLVRLRLWNFNSMRFSEPSLHLVHDHLNKDWDSLNDMGGEAI